MSRIALVIASAALMAACQPQAPDGSAAEPPADAPAGVAPLPATTTAPEIANDFQRDLNLTGTEPFWGVKIRSTEMTLSRPDEMDITIPKPEPVVTGGEAVWRGSAFTVRLTPTGDCSDGMSDRVYPFAAEVSINGQTLKGCGARADAVFPPA